MYNVLCRLLQYLQASLVHSIVLCPDWRELMHLECLRMRFSRSPAISFRNNNNNILDAWHPTLDILLVYVLSFHYPLILVPRTSNDWRRFSKNARNSVSDYSFEGWANDCSYNMCAILSSFRISKCNTRWSQFVDTPTFSSPFKHFRVVSILWCGRCWSWR